MGAVGTFKEGPELIFFYMVFRVLVLLRLDVLGWFLVEVGTCVSALRLDRTRGYRW